MKSLGLAWLAATCPNTWLQHAEFQCLLHTIAWKDKAIYTPQVVKTLPAQELKICIGNRRKSLGIFISLMVHILVPGRH